MLLILIYLVGTLLAAASVVGAVPECTGASIRIRKEIRDLSPDEWLRYKNAVLTLHKRPKPSNISAYENFAYTHVKYWSTPHGDPRFLPWHRVMLAMYEDQLRQIDPTVVIPYWGWDEDSNSPEQSPVFNADLYGSSDPQKQCIPDGPFRFGTFVSGSQPDNAINMKQEYCVARGFNKADHASRFTSTAVLAQLINQAPTFSNFSLQMEINPHGQAHTWVGGDMAQRRSPNDPLFFAHHAFIDKLYGDFQDARQLPYDRQAYTWVSRAVSLTDTLLPFTWNADESAVAAGGGGRPVTVGDVQDSFWYCVIYQQRQTAGAGSSLARRSAGSGANDTQVASAVAALNGTLPPIPAQGTDTNTRRKLVQLSPSWAAMMGIPYQVVREHHAHVLALERQIVRKVKSGDIDSLKYPHAKPPGTQRTRRAKAKRQRKKQRV
ncbi:hypothetical protein RI367_001117 [Sorochytrium milnesiophthora]